MKKKLLTLVLIVQKNPDSSPGKILLEKKRGFGAGFFNGFGGKVEPGKV